MKVALKYFFDALKNGCTSLFAFDFKHLLLSMMHMEEILSTYVCHHVSVNFTISCGLKSLSLFTATLGQQSDA